MTIGTLGWIIISVVVAALSGVAGWLIATTRAQRQLTALTIRAVQAETTLESERNAQSEQTATAVALEARMREAFAALSQDALKENATQAMDRIEIALKARQDVAQSELNGLLKPLQASLADYRQQIVALEHNRDRAYGGLEQQLASMKTDQQQLHSATQNLVKALRQPQVRGRWGELQLRRVIELAGMSELCDFTEQMTSTTSDGQQQRPDVRIKLPNDRCIIVDAKAPLSAYLDALEAPDDEACQLKLAEHARQVRSHITSLASKVYQESIDGAHTFVVLFIPGEVFYNAALEHDSDLLEYAFTKKIILANPGTLIGLLKAVALGWEETRLAENAKEIEKLGADMYRRLATLTEHLIKLGGYLNKATTAYNASVSSLERNLLTSARRMNELHGRTTSIPAPDGLELRANPPSHPDLMNMPMIDDSGTSHPLV